MLMRQRGMMTAVLLAAVLAGCGGGASDEEQVRDVVTSFVQAGKDRDAAAACDLLAADQVKSVESFGSGRSCAEVLQGVFSQAKNVETQVKIEDVRVEGDRATVDATVKAPGSGPRAESILVVKEDGDWKLASASL